MRRIVIALIACLVTMTACTSTSTTAQTHKSPTPTGSSSPPRPSLTPSSPLPSFLASVIAYWTFEPGSQTLHAYRVADGRDRIVFRGPQEEALARFESPTLLTFVGTSPTKLMEVSVTGGVARTLFSSGVNIYDFAWSAGRTAVAIVGADAKGFGIFVWHKGGALSLERRLTSQSGKCGREIGEDERISWSPDGTRILVVATSLGFSADPTHPTMFVVSHGRDVVHPRLGTEARWTSDGHTIIYMTWGSPFSWHLLDADTGHERTLPLPQGDFASMSPDGSLLAYERPHDLSVHVYTIATSKDQRVFSDAITPVWIDPHTLVVNRVKRCSAGCDCGPEGYKTLGLVKFRFGGQARPFPVLIDSGASSGDISYAEVP